MGAFVSVFRKNDYEIWILYIIKKLKTDFFQKLLFSTSSKKLKTGYFDNLIIFKNLSKLMKTDFFFNEKSDFFYEKGTNKHTLNPFS